MSEKGRVKNMKSLNEEETRGKIIGRINRDRDHLRYRLPRKSRHPSPNKRKSA